MAVDAHVLLCAAACSTTSRRDRTARPERHVTPGDRRAIMPPRPGAEVDRLVLDGIDRRPDL
jgi:hypothetical protein